MMELSPFTFALILLGAAVVLILTARLARKGVFGPAFEPRPLMNQTELRLFKMLRAELPERWSVMCQVSYGAFLRNKSFNRYMTINSKRADLVILDPKLTVAVVVEYQGKGHFGNTRNSSAQARKSDAIKRQALSEAGIPLFEVPAKFDREMVTRFIQTIVAPETGVK